VAIPVAIRSLSQRRPGCDQSDGGPDPTCGDAPREHQANGSCLTSNPLVCIVLGWDSAKLGAALYAPGEVT
jgi:hypothetical protein